MNPRTIHRAWPALATLALFALAAAAPAPHRTGPAPPSQAAATCDPFSQSGPGASEHVFDFPSGIRQPLPPGIPVAACSVRVDGSGWTYANVNVYEWDPDALLPDAATCALRSAFCTPSDMNYYTSNRVPSQTFVPPIITRSLPGVADKPREHLVFEERPTNNFFHYSHKGFYQPEGDAGMPAAMTIGTGGASVALPGTHPVMAYALCDGGEALEELRILQCVRRTDSGAPAGMYEYLQRFRVPEAVEVHWVELAANEGTPWPPSPTIVGIVDATGMAEPPATLPAAFAEAPFAAYFGDQTGPRWVAPADFDHTFELLPGRDYWLSVRNASAYLFRTHTLTATENAQFTYAIGAFHHRASTSGPWTLNAGQALSFKLIGRSQSSPLSVAPRTGFLLNVTPNPSRAAPEAEWSGATGPVRLEVFDARGRRVASNTGGAAGRWVIAARGAGPLESGVYFVRARDSEGARADERLVIVR